MTYKKLLTIRYSVSLKGFNNKRPNSNLKNLGRLYFIIFVFCHWGLISQELLTSDEAYNRYQQLSAEMAKSFPEDAIKTYSRTSFSEQQLETYLSQHFQRLDLLPIIKDRPTFIMDAYLHSGNWFRAIGFIELTKLAMNWPKLIRDGNFIKHGAIPLITPINLIKNLIKSNLKKIIEQNL